MFSAIMEGTPRQPKGNLEQINKREKKKKTVFKSIKLWRSLTNACFALMVQTEKIYFPSVSDIPFPETLKLTDSVIRNMRNSKIYRMKATVSQCAHTCMHAHAHTHTPLPLYQVGHHAESLESLAQGHRGQRGN